MFEDEREEWDKFFNFYKKKFNEEVGIMPGIYEDDEFEIDFVVGEDSSEILGIRVMQSVPFSGDEYEDDEDEAEIDEIPTKDDESDGEEDDDEEDEEVEDEGDMYEMVQYDLIKTEMQVSDLVGEPLFQLDFGGEDEDDGEEDEESPDDEEDEEDEGEDEDEAPIEPFKLVLYGRPLVKDETEEPEPESIASDVEDDEDEDEEPEVEVTGAVIIKEATNGGKKEVMVFMEHPDLK